MAQKTKQKQQKKRRYNLPYGEASYFFLSEISSIKQQDVQKLVFGMYPWLGIFFETMHVSQPERFLIDATMNT